MTGRAFLICTTTFLAGVAALPAQTPSRPTQTFRAGTDVVMVDVSVRSGGRAVADLRAEDFVLTDNGVPQRIETVETSAVPIDVTLVVDLSGNPRGPWVPRVARSKVISEIEAEAREVTKLLRPEDRVRLLVNDTYVEQVWPLQPVSNVRPIHRVGSNGLSSLFDTLAAALLQPVEPARRHVVIARTKGLDTISVLNAETVRAVAERSDVLFHLVMMETALDNDEELSKFQCRVEAGPEGGAPGMGLCWPTRRFWVPFQRRLITGWPLHQLLPDGQTLAAAAAATGGQLHQAVLLSVPSLTGTFRRAFEDFRSSYVLRYTPQGVTRGGWHTLAVTVPKEKSAAVRARKGYGVEEPAPPAPAAAIVAEPRTLTELTTAYERGAYQAVVDGLSQISDPARLMREFEERGNPWPAKPRREAAFAVELAGIGLLASAAPIREDAEKLLVRFSTLIRHPLEPDVFERYWYFAALTLLEGAVRPATTHAFVNRALERFPTEPQFILARAIATDQRWVSGRPTRVSAQEAARVAAQAQDELRQHYEAAIALPEVAVEARVRYGWVLYRTGQHGEALAQLTAAGAGAIPEVPLRYLRELFLGHVLDALNRQDDAIEAYRRAQAIIPGAQSAQVALMSALLKGGDRAGAEALAERIQSEQAVTLDPWRMYWQGRYRLYPQAMARVRELIR